MNIKPATIFFYLGLMICLICTQARAIPDCAFNNIPSNTPPNYGISPTDLYYELYLFDMIDINTVRQEFEIDFFIKGWWHDPRLIEPMKSEETEPCKTTHNDIWAPQFLFLNSHNYQLRMPEQYYVFKDGTVRIEQRVVGKFLANFDLKRFPLDSQVLPVEFISPTHFAKDLIVHYVGGGVDQNFSIAGWTEKKLSGSYQTYKMVINDIDDHVNIIELPYFRFDIHVDRQFGFYFWKVVLPLVVMVVISWTVFWIRPTKFEVQATIGTGTLLSIVAFLFSLQFILPKIPYLTIMDIHVYLSLFFVALALTESVFSCNFAARNQLLLANKLDLVSRVMFPLVFLILMVIIWF